VGTVETIAPEDFERVIEVDLLGVWRTIRATLPQVIERRGYVLAVSSLAAAAHAPLMGSYAAAKAGVEAFANALRGELAHRGTDRVPSDIAASPVELANELARSRR
jgi:NAD(P)-dependent dehydrogenase (short-subunit alcohol dehydrogenase family)